MTKKYTEFIVRVYHRKDDVWVAKGDMCLWQ